MALSPWLVEARQVKAEARKKESPQVFLQPIFEGKQLCLRYDGLTLNDSELTDKQKKILRLSAVPRNLYNETYRNWGSYDPQVLYVFGVILASRKNPKRKRFVATHVRGENGKEYHTQILTLQLLFSRGFLTPIAQCSWMNTKDVAVSTLKRRLEAKADLRIENKSGKAFRPEAPIGLELFDCMGFVSKSKKEKVKTKKGKKK